jgi:hypothetical protein
LNDARAGALSKENPKFLEGPGQGQHVYPLRSRLQQDPRAFLYRRPGSEDVVDEQDMFFSDSLRSENLECATDIFLPFRARELSLGFSVAGALEGSEIQGDGVRAADAAGQEKRLIESPLAEAAGMKRNAEDEFEIGKGELRVLIFGQESAQRLGQPGCALIFETMDDLRHQPFIGADGSGPCEVTLLGETFGAKVVLSGGVPETQAAAGTTRVGKKLCSFGTKGTRVIIGQFPQATAAEETLGREEEIDQRMPEGGHT